MAAYRFTVYQAVGSLTMRVLLIHNFYQQPGGEDAVFAQETALLRQHGVDVETLTFTNDQFDGTLSGNLRSSAKSFYNPESARRTRETIDRFRPDVVHVHNLFYTASAAVIRVAKQRGVPVVMTLHNYRLVCVNGLLMREGKIPCETCLTQTTPLAGIRHACFRDSVWQSAQLSLITTLHKLTGIWRSVDRFIMLTNFARQKILESSLQLRPEQVVVKPNFVFDPGPADAGQRQSFFLFAGRLSAEKGIATLLDAARCNTLPLTIAGSGPLATEVTKVAGELAHVNYIGWQSRSNVLVLLKNCRALVVPSVWYEGLPTIILEAFATGTPIICSDQENLNQIIQDGKTGLLFKTGNGADLSRIMVNFNQQPELSKQLANNSRQQYTRFNPATWLHATLSLYDELMGNSD